jgi:hypothetical protein
MKLFGFLLVTVGFLAGAYYLTGVKGAVLGPGFIASFVVALVGVVILRVVTRKRAARGEKVTAEIQTVERSLAYLAGGVEELEQAKNNIDVYDLPREIDKRFNESLEKFVTARESIAVAYGLPVYADVMSHFAAGERYLNRVWSCSVDGYIDEAYKYLGHAREQFTEGLAKLKKHTSHSTI